VREPHACHRIPVKSTSGITAPADVAVSIFTSGGSTSPHPRQLDGFGIPRVAVGAGVAGVDVNVLVVVTGDEGGTDGFVLAADRPVVGTVVLAAVVEELHADKRTPTAIIGTRIFIVRPGSMRSASHVPMSQIGAERCLTCAGGSSHPTQVNSGREPCSSWIAIRLSRGLEHHMRRVVDFFAAYRFPPCCRV
jgi:hypothetical protein